jgi:diguanylate cyclase (GGDEF)-like protein
MQSLLVFENRPAGLLVLSRNGNPYTENEQRLFDYFANQLSLLIGTVRAQEQVQKLADTDEMTGIWNRRYFQRQLEAEVERARIYKLPLSLMTFDVDSFKEINDTFGHPMGDVVLSELCGIVRESLRQPDVFARVGGDEFAILVPHTDAAGAQHLADRILRKVRRLAIPGDGNASVTCSVSIGIASYVPQETTAEDLMHRADERLYVAKKSGKNQYA